MREFLSDQNYFWILWPVFKWLLIAALICSVTISVFPGGAWAPQGVHVDLCLCRVVHHQQMASPTQSVLMESITAGRQTQCSTAELLDSAGVPHHIHTHEQPEVSTAGWCLTGSSASVVLLSSAPPHSLRSTHGAASSQRHTLSTTGSPRRVLRWPVSQ